MFGNNDQLVADLVFVRGRVGYLGKQLEDVRAEVQDRAREVIGHLNLVEGLLDTQRELVAGLHSRMGTIETYISHLDQTRRDQQNAKADELKAEWFTNVDGERP